MGARGDGRIPLRGPSSSTFSVSMGGGGGIPSRRRVFRRSAVEADVDEGWTFDANVGCGLVGGGNVDGRMGRSRGECEDVERIVGSGCGQCSLRSITVPMTRYGSRSDSRSVDARSGGGGGMWAGAMNGSVVVMVSGSDKGEGWW